MVRTPLIAALSIALGVTLGTAPCLAQGGTVRILQTNSAGDDIHIIDPAANRVVDVIDGIPIPHGVTYHPDGSAYYVSNEHDETLDIVSTRTLKVTKQIPLTGGPNNIAITPDGRKLYVAIISGNAGVDVIDTRTGENVRHVPTAGGVHNVYVTPDGKHAVAGMIGARMLMVIDVATDEPAWSLEFAQRRRGASPLLDGGVRPMEFETNADGSTRRIFVQISGWHGFYVVDFARREVVDRIELPKLPLSRVDNDALQGSPSHGLDVTADGRTLWVASKPHNSVYAYSLPELELQGRVEVGYHPDWLTSTPDSRYLYVANAGSNDVSAVDRETMKEIARIPVGHTPKRNHTGVLPRADGAAASPEGVGVETDGSAAVQEALDFAFYREWIEPILLRDRGGYGPGEAACVTCHVKSGTPMKLQPLEEDADGGVYWPEAHSRQNFEVVSRLVTPGDPERSRLLREPLASDAGGSTLHVGGKFWRSRADPEWQMLAEWVRAAGPRASSAFAAEAAPVPDFEFFRTCVQRIFLDREADRMECAACHGGGARGFAQALPEGRDFWNLEESRENFGVVMRYVEPGHPLRSRFLTHPLHPDAGGDHYHSGGRRWPSQDDPEWQMLAAWVRGEAPTCVVEDR